MDCELKSRFENRDSEEELSISQPKSKIEELPIPYQEEGGLGSTVHW
jgi:hypothetical protein